LREALAAADHDFVLAEPDSKLKRVRDRLFAGKKMRGTKRAARRGRYYINLLATGFFVVVTAAILLNALAWQKTRHPAPLFAHAAAPIPHAKEPAIAEVITAPPAPRPQSTPIQTHDKPLEKVPAPKPMIEKLPIEKLSEKPAAGHPQHAPANDLPARPHDKISQLIKAPVAPSGHPSSAVSAPVEPNKKVLAAQRALIKLGFVVNPNGIAGATTRQAIERYERDRGLPVHGELTPGIMRKLAAEAGISID
jgi:Putative peptidoglycan binding domain